MKQLTQTQGSESECRKEAPDTSPYSLGRLGPRKVNKDVENGNKDIENKTFFLWDKNQRDWIVLSSSRGLSRVQHTYFQNTCL